MRIQKNLIKLLFFACLIITTISCKKSKKGEMIPNEPLTPIKTEHGTVIGTATKVKIGATGGSIAIPDNYISINVPAGAVDAETEFSIQEVQTNAAISTGRLFRILPEGVTLKKPVEITFKYTDAEIAGANEDFLYPCYQSSDGLWHKVMDCTLDKTTKTLKVSTTHFSDWGILREVELKASKYELGANEVIDLEALVLDYYDEAVATGSDLKPEQIVEWKVVSGGGTITGGKNPKVQYKAPDTDKKIEVIVEVTVKNIVKKSDPKRPGNGGLVITRKTLTILPEEYVTWNIGGVKHSAMFFNLGVFNGKVIFTATSPTESVAFNTNGTGLGKYSIGDLSKPKTSSLSASYGNRTFESEYTECNTFKKVYGDGSIVYEVFGNVGEIVQGTFSGFVYTYSNCTEDYRHVTGTFRIRRLQ